MLKNILIEVFLIKSKIFFSLILFLSLSCAPARIQTRQPKLFPNQKIETQEIQQIVKAPWEVWQVRDYKNEAFRSGIKKTDEGDITKAKVFFEQAITMATSAEEAEDALLMLASSFLKLGQGSSALGAISKYANKRGVTSDQLDSRFSLLAGYAYVNQKDTNQAFAWFSQAFKAGSGSSAIATEARRASRQLARINTDQELSILDQKWRGDSFVSSLLLEEKQRRQRGGLILGQSSFDNWFKEGTYSYSKNQITDLIQNQTNSNVGVETTNISNMQDINKLKFAAILPFSGTYSAYAEKFAKGIELALEQAGIISPLIRADSNSKSAQASYQSLVTVDKVSAIFGPLLVKDVEDIASLTSSLRVPVVTYAKKRGLPDLSDGIFRLGATAENQLSEISRYAEQSKLITDIIIFLPEDALGEEFLDAAKVINARYPKKSMRVIKYDYKSFDSINYALGEAVTNLPQGIVLVDTPIRIENLMRGIKNNPHLSNLPVFASAITADPAQISRYYDLMEGVTFVSLYNETSGEFIVTKFKDDYKNRFNENPDLLAAQGYDSANFILNAYKSFIGENLIGAEIQALQESRDYSGVTGNLHPEINGEISRTLRIVQLRNKSLVEVN